MEQVEPGPNPRPVLQGSWRERNPLDVPAQHDAPNALGECRAKETCYLQMSGFQHYSKIPNTWIQASATNETTGWQDYEFSITAVTGSPVWAAGGRKANHSV